MESKVTKIVLYLDCEACKIRGKEKLKNCEGKVKRENRKNNLFV